MLQKPGAAGGNLLEHLVLESIGAIRGGGLFAWTNATGIQLLFEHELVGEFLSVGTFDLIVGTDLVTDTRALACMTAVTASSPNFRARALVAPEQSLFHPKLAWFEHADHVSIVVGSGNLTSGGLRKNWEAFSVQHVLGDERHRVLADIDAFLSHISEFVHELDDPAVLERARRNDGDERSIRAPRTEVAPGHAFDDQDEVLVAELPKNGDRLSQAGFDKQNYETFFGVVLDETKQRIANDSQRVLFRQIGLDGFVGDVESRKPVPVKSKNYRFELDGTKGHPYIKGSPPVGVFVRAKDGQFYYSLALPGDEPYELLRDYLAAHWIGSKSHMRRVRRSVTVARNAWPDGALWTAALPPL